MHKCNIHVPSRTADLTNICHIEGVLFFFLFSPQEENNAWHKTFWLHESFLSLSSVHITPLCLYTRENKDDGNFCDRPYFPRKLILEC